MTGIHLPLWKNIPAPVMSACLVLPTSHRRTNSKNLWVVELGHRYFKVDSWLLQLGNAMAGVRSRLFSNFPKLKGIPESCVVGAEAVCALCGDWLL